MASCTRIEGAIQAYLDGELPQADVVVLEEHLATCASCARDVRRQRAGNALLFETLGEFRLARDLTTEVMAHLPEMELSQRRSHEVTYRAKHPRQWSTLLFRLVPAMVPVLLVVLGMIIVYSWPPDDPGPGTVGMVTGQSGKVQTSSDAQPMRRGVATQDFVGQRQRFETASDANLMISLAGPTHVKLAPDTRVQIESARELKLETGSIWLDVCPGPENFRVTTPWGTVTVFGTTFGVTVDKEATQVVLDDGELTLEKDKDFTVLRSGQSAEARPEVGVSDPKIVDVDAKLAWAQVIQPEPSALAQFLQVVPVTRPSAVRAHRWYVVPTHKENVMSISFEWEQQAGGAADFCSYHVYVTDDALQPLFKGYINGDVFAAPGQRTYELAVPENSQMGRTNVLHVNVVPDFSTGSTEVSFGDITAFVMRPENQLS